MHSLFIWALLVYFPRSFIHSFIHFNCSLHFQVYPWALTRQDCDSGDASTAVHSEGHGRYVLERCEWCYCNVVHMCNERTNKHESKRKPDKQANAAIIYCPEWPLSFKEFARMRYNNTAVPYLSGLSFCQTNWGHCLLRGLMGRLVGYNVVVTVVLGNQTLWWWMLALVTPLNVRRGPALSRDGADRRAWADCEPCPRYPWPLS